MDVGNGPNPVRSYRSSDRLNLAGSGHSLLLSTDSLDGIHVDWFQRPLAVPGRLRLATRPVSRAQLRRRMG